MFIYNAKIIWREGESEKKEEEWEMYRCNMRVHNSKREKKKNDVEAQKNVNDIVLKGQQKD